MVKFAAAGYVCVDYYPDFNNRYYITGNGVDVLFNLLDIKKGKDMEASIISAVSVIALHELTYTSNSVRANTFLAFEPLIVTAFIYFVITYVLKKLVGILERRLRAHD